MDLFFVLSGFLITTLLFEEHGRTGGVDLRAFYVRRARRLLPALTVMVAVYLTLAQIRQVESERTLLIGGLASFGYVSNFVLSFWRSSMSTGLSHTWSLSAEEQFYLVWPVLILLALRGGRRMVMIVLGVVIVIAEVRGLVLMPGNREAFGPEYRSTIALAIGCLFALLASDARVRIWASRLWIPAAMIVAAAFLTDLTPTFATAHPVFCACCAIVILSVLNPTPLSWLLARPVVAWVGRISYPLYLWHVPVLVLLGLGIAGSDQTAKRVVALELSVVAAAASYYFVEMPIRRRGRHGRPSDRVERVGQPASGNATAPVVAGSNVVSASMPPVNT